MEHTIILNSGQPIEVLFCDEVSLDIDCSLRYIESGQKEVASYVNNVAKPLLDKVITDAALDMNIQITKGVEDATQSASDAAARTISASIEEAEAKITSYVEQNITPDLQAAQEVASSFAQAAESSASASSISALTASENASNAALSATEACGFASSAAASAEEAADIAANLHIGFNLFDVKWSDHLQNDMAWLRADTFSWASGNVYTAAYDELSAEYNDSASTTFTDGVITGKVTPKGYRIVDASQEQAVLELYNSTGLAWYYILDETNTRFKLPRVANPSLFEKYVSAPVIGNGMTLGLTNGSVNFGLASAGNNQRLFAGTGVCGIAASNPYGVAGTTSSEDGLGVAKDPTKSGMIADLSLATINAPQGYLCFYVGNFDKPAITQTAGLNAELFNNKADLNLNNVNQAGTAFIAHQAMPSTRKVLFTLGANGTTYISPADGYFSFSFSVNQTNGLRQLYNHTTNMCSDVRIGTTYGMSVNMPVSKGDVIELNYEGAATDYGCNFIYAQGAC